MQTVSSTYTSILANGGWHECKLEINGVVYDMDTLVSMRTSGGLFETIGVGNTIAGTIDVELIAKSNTIPTMAQLRPYVRATNGTTNSEWLPKGVYWIDTREYDKESGVLKLSGMDAMLKGEQDYMQTGAQGTWPQIDRNVVCDIAKKLGIGSNQFTAITNPTGNPKNKGWYYKKNNLYYLSSDTSVQTGTTYYEKTSTGLDPRTMPLLNKYYKVGYPGYGEGAYTVREVLGYIGSMYAGNWIINEQGKLRLVVLGDIPAETAYLINENDLRITLGGDRLVMTT